MVKPRGKPLELYLKNKRIMRFLKLNLMMLNLEKYKKGKLNLMIINMKHRKKLEMRSTTKNPEGKIIRSGGINNPST